MAPKYKEMYKRMVTENPELFKEFREVHDKFAQDQAEFRTEFNKVGDKIVDQIRIYVDHLCRTSEGSGYGNYSSKLSEKFWDVVRIEFPEIDEVGIE